MDFDSWTSRRSNGVAGQLPKRPVARGPERPILWDLLDLTRKWEPQESVSVLSPVSSQDTLVAHRMWIAILIKDTRGIWASAAIAEIIADVVEVVRASASARSHQ